MDTLNLFPPGLDESVMSACAHYISALESGDATRMLLATDRLLAAVARVRHETERMLLRGR